MHISIISAILGLTALASAAPAQPREVADREAAQYYGESLRPKTWLDTARMLTRSDITYIDKVKREAVEDKRKADAQFYDITYIDKVKREAEDRRKADAQYYDITYIGKSLFT